MGVAVITGASAGVGRATSRMLAARGWSLGLLARGRAGLEAAASEADALGVETLVVPTDVADPVAVEDAAARAEEALGPIDLWVNSAMVTVFGRFPDIAPDDFRRVTDVTYHGSVNGIRSAMTRMLPRDQGQIVQVGSAVAFRGIPLQTAYSGAKHAVEGFVEAAREELLHEGSAIVLSLVHLPAMNTPQFTWGKVLMDRRPQPVPPILSPEAAADAIVWVTEHPRREFWVGWSTVRSVGANRVAPRLLDRYVSDVAWNGQLTDDPADDGPDNLWTPVDVDLGAAGRFDDREVGARLQITASKHRWTLLGVAVAVAVAAAAAATARRQTR